MSVTLRATTEGSLERARFSETQNEGHLRDIILYNKGGACALTVIIVWSGLGYQRLKPERGCLLFRYPCELFFIQHR